MKFPNLLLVALILLVISCNKNDNTEALEAVAGHWHIWDYEPNANSPAEESFLAKEAILQLVETGCDPIEFTFNANGGVRYVDGMRYLNPTLGDNGVEIRCASKYDDKSGIFDFDYSKLTLTFDSETIVLEAALEGKYFTTNVDNMLINGVNVSGKLYFIRETGHSDTAK